MSYKIKTLTENIRLITTTNIGAFVNSPIGETEYTMIQADNKEAFDKWCSELQQLNREFEIISD